MSIEARALALTVAYAAGARLAEDGAIGSVWAVSHVLFPSDCSMRASFVNGYVDHFPVAIYVGLDAIARDFA
jgi:hypothetical protein